jgi:hypothetical protein
VGSASFIRRIGYAHDGDESVPVQVLGPVLVDAAVIVIVVRARVPRPLPHDRSEHRFRTVGVHSREDVDDLLVQDRPDLCFLLRSVEEIADRFQRQSAAHQVVALEISDHQDGGALLQRLSGWIPDLHDPDLSTLDGCPHRAHAGHVRVVH